MLLAACAPPGPRALLQGKRLLERGKYAEAIERFKTATVLLATNAPPAEVAQAWNDLGVACHHAGRAAEAEQAYRRALALNHDLTEAHYNLGCLWLEQNYFENARTEFTTYTLRRSTEPEGFIRLGTAQLWVGASASGAARIRTLSEAENSFKEALKLSPQNPEALNGLGLVRLYHSQPAEAAQYFSSALRQAPAFAPALINMAVVSQSYLNQPQVAIEKYRAYLALKPLPANAEAVRQALHQLETAPPARPGASAPAAGGGLQPDSAAAAASPAAASSAQTAQEAKQAGESPAQSAQDARPGSGAGQSAAAAGAAQGTTPKRSLLQRLFHHSEGSPAQPVAAAAPTNAPAAGATPSLAAEENLPPLPTQPGVRYTYRTPSKPVTGNHAEAEQAFTRGYQAQLARHWSEAIKEYRAAIQLDPSYFDAYYNLSLAASEFGELRTALAAAETAVVIKPEDPRARYKFALVLTQATYWTDAAHELEKLLAYTPNSADAHLALANLYAQRLHQPTKARPHYQRVLELEPHCKQADNIRYWLVQNK